MQLPRLIAALLDPKPLRESQEEASREQGSCDGKISFVPKSELSVCCAFSMGQTQRGVSNRLIEQPTDMVAKTAEDLGGSISDQ